MYNGKDIVNLDLAPLWEISLYHILYLGLPN